MKLKNELIKELNRKGNIIRVNDKTTIELIDYSFIVQTFDYSVSEKDSKYIQEKFRKYKKNILLIDRIFKEDNNTRQGVIQFNFYDKSPECITQIQFIKRNEQLYTIVTSRSLDVENKLICDIEIARLLSKKINKENFPVIIKFNVGSLHKYL